VRKQLVIHVGKDIETIEGDPQVKDLVITRGAEDLLKLDYSIECTDTVVVNIKV
jgi:hypothetical protein